MLIGADSVAAISVCRTVYKSPCLSYSFPFLSTLAPSHSSNVIKAETVVLHNLFFQDINKDCDLSTPSLLGAINFSSDI